MRLHGKFFEQETHLVARQLIGKKLVRHTQYLGNYFKISGIIVETEAYGYKDDPASHSYRKATIRNNAMFGPVGHAYIYYIYGNHYCFNIVAKNKNTLAGAVLIRSLQPLEGINIMKIFRRTDNLFNLTSGPGKITQALKISQKFNNLSLIDNINNKFLYIEDCNDNILSHYFIAQTSRIGIKKATEKKWRFLMLNNYDNSMGYVPNKFISSKLKIYYN